MLINHRIIPNLVISQSQKTITSNNSMGQKLQTSLKLKNKYEVHSSHKSISSSPPYNNIELLTIVQGSSQPKDAFSSQSRSSLISISQKIDRSPQLTKQTLQRQQHLLQFIGQIIYHCKLHMKRQRKYHYKISALLFYKYFFDKFRQLLTRYWLLYQKKVIFRQEYEKKVNLVYQVKDTFIKIKKFVYSKIPFLSQRTKSYLDENSQLYCFNDKEFFTELLYPQVGEILKYYFQNTSGELNQLGINQCYIRMVKSIFIIQELEYKNFIIPAAENQSYVDYDIDNIQGWSDEKIKVNLIRDYELFQQQIMRS